MFPFRLVHFSGEAEPEPDLSLPIGHHLFFISVFSIARKIAYYVNEDRKLCKY